MQHSVVTSEVTARRASLYSDVHTKSCSSSSEAGSRGITFPSGLCNTTRPGLAAAVYAGSEGLSTIVLDYRCAIWFRNVTILRIK